MKNLLIVDDDPHLLESLGIVFKGLYNVFLAPSAEEGGGIVENSAIDVVLLDVVLPGMDGIEFLELLRETHPDLPVVMLSGAPSIRPVLQALELGACDYIRKPFDIVELRLVVSRALKSFGLQQRIRDLERRLEAMHFELDKPLKESVEEYERRIIEGALRQSGGVQTRAAEALGTTRRILRYRIEKLQIETGTPEGKRSR